jgi:hypothetical protein
MTIQMILQAIVNFIIGYLLISFLLKMITKKSLRKQSNKFKNSLDLYQIAYFYETFGFHYEDIVKYAPELDRFISNRLQPTIRDNVSFKMHEMQHINDAIRNLEGIDIIRFKQTIENIKNQKALEKLE